MGRTLTPYVALLVAVLALGACTGGDDPTPPATGNPTTSTTAPPTPTSTSVPSSPTTTPTSPLAEVPIAAKEQTPSGAEAFTKFFLIQANVAYRTSQPILVTQLSLTSCKTCASMTKTLETYRKNKQTYNGDFVTPLTIVTQSIVTTGAKIFVTTKTISSTLLDSSGKVVRTYPADDASYVVLLTWTSSAWRVSQIQSAA